MAIIPGQNHAFNRSKEVGSTITRQPLTVTVTL
jgi:hypothetical protein